MRSIGTHGSTKPGKMAALAPSAMRPRKRAGERCVERRGFDGGCRGGKDLARFACKLRITLALRCQCLSRGVRVAKHMRIWLRLSYRCCGMEWDDEWPDAFKLECPDCGALVEAFSTVEIGPRDASKTPVDRDAHAGSKSSKGATGHGRAT